MNPDLPEPTFFRGKKKKKIKKETEWGSLNDASSLSSCLNLWDLWICYFVRGERGMWFWQMWLKVHILGWDYYPGLFRGPNLTTQVLEANEEGIRLKYKKEKEAEESPIMRGTWHTTSSVEDGVRGPLSKECGWSLKARPHLQLKPGRRWGPQPCQHKAPNPASSLSEQGPTARNTSLQTLRFSLWGPCQTYEKMRNCFLLKPLNLWHFVNGNHIKLIQWDVDVVIRQI